jgi:DMSO/TMAO reductase YedYZ molybdopterin-dependent catalytic subunit
MTSPEENPAVTPLEELFTYHIFGIPDAARGYLEDPDSYELTIGGLVNRELRFSLKQLWEDFPQVSGDMVLQCMTNVHWGRMHMTGPRLLDILEKAGIGEKAFKIGVHAAEGFTSNLRIDEIREQPDAYLLAHSMNDQPLSLEHGFPIRMTADGKYGYKWPKWVSGIELVDFDFKGHYEGKRGWSDTGTRGQPVT